MEDETLFRITANVEMLSYGELHRCAFNGFRVAILPLKGWLKSEPRCPSNKYDVRLAVM